MNKEKLMQFLSDAIDKGAKVGILFHGENKTKEQAAIVANQFKEIIGEDEVEELQYEGCQWLKVRSQYLQLDHFYNVKPSHFMEEDISFDGGVEDVG